MCVRSLTHAHAHTTSCVLAVHGDADARIYAVDPLSRSSSASFSFSKIGFPENFSYYDDDGDGGREVIMSCVLQQQQR